MQRQQQAHVLSTGKAKVYGGHDPSTKNQTRTSEQRKRYYRNAQNVPVLTNRLQTVYISSPAAKPHLP